MTDAILPLGFTPCLYHELTCIAHLNPIAVEGKRTISDCLLQVGRTKSLTFGDHDGAEITVFLMHI